jgi:hypothetical protein
MKNGIEIVNLNKRVAKTRMLANIPTQKVDEKTEKFLSNASLYLWNNASRNHSNVNTEVSTDNILPVESQFVNATFRALSQIHLVNRGLDFSGKGVLEAAVELLQGKTVYPNHDYLDINNALGSVSNAYWDAKGENSNGIPGINAEIKIDALCNFKIARGLLMQPPSINAASLSIVFEFEYSHPDLVEKGRFWDLLGEEVEGSIVRLIVTKIINILEMSLVFLGEDPTARHHNAEIGSDKTDENTAETQDKKENLSASEETKGEKLMKVTVEQKQALGISAEGDDVPEQTVLDAALALAEQKSKTGLSAKEIADLSSKAQLADKLLESKRKEVIALATLVEVGREDGELSAIMKKVIENADADDLAELEADYRKKVPAKFANKSEENHKPIDDANGETPATTNKVDASGLH